MIKTWYEHLVKLCPLPVFVVKCDLRHPDSTGQIEEKIELWAFEICEVASSELSGWEGGGCKLLAYPLKHALLGVIAWPKDAVVPSVEVRIFLVEDMDFANEELVKVPEHERSIGGCWVEPRLCQKRKTWMFLFILSLLRSGVKVTGSGREGRRWAGMPPKQMGQRPLLRYRLKGPWGRIGPCVSKHG